MALRREGVFLAGLGVVAVVVSAPIHWRAPRSLAPLLVLLCFMAPQAIALPAVLGTISGFADFPGSSFESSIDPAARTVSGFDATIGLCSITVGGISQAPRPLDVDLYTLTGRYTMDSIPNRHEGYALLGEVAKSVRRGCAGGVELMGWEGGTTNFW